MLTTFSRLSLALALLLGAAPCQDTAKFGIATWNIEFLGAAPHLRRDTPPRTAEDVQAIGDKIREFGVAVVGVQEICGEQPLQQVATAIGPSWRHLLGTTGSWDDGKTQQGVGFLYDNAVLELVHAEELLMFPRERDGVAVFHRKPVTACFRHRATGCDFRLVVVHLKAGRKARDLDKRRVEATHLREWIDMLQANAGEDQDIAVLGDFNSSYGSDPERILEADGSMQYLDQRKASPTILWFDDPIDQVVAAKGFAELQRDSLLPYTVSGEEPRNQWRKTYSDHFPVLASIRCQRDDDPQATFWRGPAGQHLPLSRRPAPAAAATPWPPAVGSYVWVVTALNRPDAAGKLLHPLPEGPGGWVVIESKKGIEAFPIRNVTSIRIK